MKIFKRKKILKKAILIVGCGSLGASLAVTLVNQGKQVIVMDKNTEAFNILPQSFAGAIFVADGTKLEDLKKAHIEKVATLVAVTNNDNVNIMIAQLGHFVFKTTKVVARIYDKSRQGVYKKLGVETISLSHNLLKVDL